MLELKVHISLAHDEACDGLLPAQIPQCLIQVLSDAPCLSTISHPTPNHPESAMTAENVREQEGEVKYM